MSYYSERADEKLSLALKLAKRKYSVQTRIAVSILLLDAYNYYRWAQMYQHAFAMEDMLKKLQEDK